ncbi:HAD-IA family hydrolase [bacterium]|nr:HAD-IA family hydrolase [bacterium]
MAEVKAIFWDLGGVLVPFSHRVLWRNFLRLLPLGVFLRWVFRKEALQRKLSGPLNDFETGRCSFMDLKEAVERTLDVKLETESFRSAWNDIFGPAGETALLASELQKKYPSFVLSNTNYEHLKRVREDNPSLEFMNGWLPSYELHALKPQKEFYEKALSIIGVRAENALLIDDRAENVEGAAALGVQTILYRDLKDLKIQLKKLSLL